MPLPTPPESPDLVAERVIHQETIKLAVLIAVVVAGFFVTRAIAEDNRAASLQDAAEWYGRGQDALERRDPAQAVEAFRHATVKNRGERRYALGLADALAATKQDDAATAVLLTLRDAAPEDPEINLQLARLSVDRHATADAVHYYQSALYAPWPTDLPLSRRQVREELIRFLLAHAQVSRAISEIAALGADLPDDAAAHVEVGRLFASAGDHAHALEQFERALRLAPNDREALAGAGLAAFNRRRYSVADQYLHTASDSTPGVTDTRTLVALILGSDPLAPRIGSAARRRRLTDMLRHAIERVSSCIPGTTGSNFDPRSELIARAQSLVSDVSTKRELEDDTIESGVDLVYRMERAVEGCPAAAPLDQALVLIGEEHGAGPS